MIFCANETSTSDVYNAINASNGRYDDIYFAGFDCGDKIIEWIKREDGPVLLGSIAQNTIDIGYSTVECLAEAIEGKDCEKDILIDGIFYRYGKYRRAYRKGYCLQRINSIHNA